MQLLFIFTIAGNKLLKKVTLHLVQILVGIMLLGVALGFV